MEVKIVFLMMKHREVIEQTVMTDKLQFYFYGFVKKKTLVLLCAIQNYLLLDMPQHCQSRIQDSDTYLTDDYTTEPRVASKIFFSLKKLHLEHLFESNVSLLLMNCHLKLAYVVAVCCSALFFLSHA